MEANVSERLSWTLREPFGAEVALNAPVGDLTEDDRAALRKLFYDRNYLVFKNLDVSRNELRELTACLGPLPPEDDEPAPILALNPDEGAFGGKPLMFHRDLVYAPKPFSAIALHALDVNPGETKTYYASGAEAYRALPDELKERIKDMKAVSALGLTSTQRVQPEDVPNADWPQTIHPLVAPHPVTGVPILLVCELMTLQVVGLEREESDALIDELLSYVTAPENIYAHAWHNGDLFVWDNFAGVHARDDNRGVTKRTLQRCTAGELSFRQAFPNFDIRAHTEKHQGEGYQGPHSKY